MIGKGLYNQVVSPEGVFYLCTVKQRKNNAVQELFTLRFVCLLVGLGFWLVSAALLITP